MPARSERALNKFLGTYDWDEEELNHERLEELKRHNENTLVERRFYRDQ